MQLSQGLYSDMLTFIKSSESLVKKTHRLDNEITLMTLNNMAAVFVLSHVCRPWCVLGNGVWSGFQLLSDRLQLKRGFVLSRGPQ